MKREIGVCWYFWTLVALAFVHALIGKSVEGAIFFSTAALVGVMNLIAREYFDAL
jgi:hypothetical protein